MPVNPMLPAAFFLFKANTAQYLQATRWQQLYKKETYTKTNTNEKLLLHFGS